MHQPWLASYPENIPHEIDDSPYRSLTHLLEASFTKFAHSSAYACMGKTLTYAEVDHLSTKVGAWLQDKDLKKGARVAIMMPNVLQYPVTIAGILRAGYVVVNVNPLHTPRELLQQLKDADVSAIFILENFAATLEAVLPQLNIPHVVVAAMGDLMGVKGMAVNFVVRHVKRLVPMFSLPNAVPFHHVLSQAATLPLLPASSSMEDLAFLQYTGGTTGVSKGAMLTHRNIVANVLQLHAWLLPGLDQTKAHTKTNTETTAAIPSLNFLCALPLYHIFALTLCNMLGTFMGAMNVLIPNPRDIRALIKEMAKYPSHVFPAVNTLYNGLLNHPDFAQLNHSSLRICVGGGMAVQQAVADKWQRVTGCPIIEGYGLSETSPVASANLTTITKATSTIGFPLPSTDMCILDDAGNVLPLGQSGEIAIRGPQVMKAYWRHPEETAKAITPDGFFKSGDIGIMDQSGLITLVDRKKDMILVSGFNVYPNDIEQVVAEHPGVLECACIGVPDDHTGEAVKIFVVPKDPALTKEALSAYCHQALTGYKHPKHIEFRKELPKSNVGKILRRALRDEASKDA